MINNFSFIKNKIINHSNKEKESCGLVIEKDKNEIDFIGLNNFSNKKDFFEISPMDFLNIKNNFNIKYICHTHLYESSTSFSYLDKKISDLLCIDGLLYIIPINKFKIYLYKEGKEVWLK